MRELALEDLVELRRHGSQEEVDGDGVHPLKGGDDDEGRWGSESDVLMISRYTSKVQERYTSKVQERYKKEME